MSEKKHEQSEPVHAATEDELLKKHLAHWETELKTFDESIEKSEQITEEDRAVLINA